MKTEQTTCFSGRDAFGCSGGQRGCENEKNQPLILIPSNSRARQRSEPSSRERGPRRREDDRKATRLRDLADGLLTGKNKIDGETDEGNYRYLDRFYDLPNYERRALLARQVRGFLWVSEESPTGGVPDETKIGGLTLIA